MSGGLIGNGFGTFLGGVIILKLKKPNFLKKLLKETIKRMEHNTLRNYYGYWNS